MTYCGAAEKMCPREKVWSTGFFPNLFLNNNDNNINKKEKLAGN